MKQRPLQGRAVDVALDAFWVHDSRGKMCLRGCSRNLFAAALVLASCALDGEGQLPVASGGASGLGGSAGLAAASGGGVSGTGASGGTAAASGAGASGVAGESGLGGAITDAGDGAAGMDAEAEAEAGGACDDHPISAEVVLGNGTHCYWLETDLQSQSGAETVCESQGGYLATIQSELENVAIETLAIGSYPVWLGMNRATTGPPCSKADYAWMTQEPMLYDSWDTLEPDCTGSAAVMIEAGKWRDRSDAYLYAYACESGPLSL